MIKHTVSCWSYPNQTINFKDSNHCGYCIPCIVRRVSVLASTTECWDDRYFIDIFSREKVFKNQRRNINDLIYFCQFVASHSISDLIYNYPEFVAIEEHQGPVNGDKIESIVKVYKGFAQDVLRLTGHLPSGLLPGALLFEV